MNKNFRRIMYLADKAAGTDAEVAYLKRLLPVNLRWDTDAAWVLRQRIAAMRRIGKL